MDQFYTGVLACHIAAGSLALLSGMVAMATRKGGKSHRGAGVTYVGSMLVVALTALFMSSIRPNPFLFAVALFSAALALSGWLPARGDNPRWSRVIGTVGIIAALLLVSIGVWWLLNANYFGVVAIVFAVVAGRFGYRDLRRHTARTRVSRTIAHVSAMGGAFIATISAVSAVNLDMLPPLVRWLWPTIVGTPLIAFAIRRYLASRSHTPHSS
jgi:uncharacterized membrane protein